MIRRAALLLALLVAPTLDAAPTLAAVRDLFDSKRYPEALDAARQVAAAEPANAAALHLLGSILHRRTDTASLAEAVACFEKASRLAPDNPVYLGDYGGASLQLAERQTSYTLAVRGRDALEKSVKLDARYLEARDGLMQFYLRAPWPLGSRTKALAHAREIGKIDPDRGLMAEAWLLRTDKKTSAVFALCEKALQTNSGHVVALYEFGRTSSLTDQRIPEGISALQNALAAPAGSPHVARSDIHYRLGLLFEKTGRQAEAIAQYELALKAEPANRTAEVALRRLAN